MNWKEDRSFVAFVALSGLFLICFAAYALWQDSELRAECVEMGGSIVVEQEHCTTTVTCTTINQVTTCIPNTNCPWRCEGLPAEKP